MSHAIIDWSIESHLVCRGLSRDWKILHRDISTRNFLWNEMNSIPAEDVASVPTVFIGHLLDARYVVLCLESWFHLIFFLGNPSTGH